jgi:hypothetical protein
MARKKIFIKIALNILIVVIVSALVWLAVIFFQKKIIAISQKIREKKIISYNLNNRDLKGAETKKEIARLDQNWLNKVESAFPYIDDTAPFIDSVDSLGRKYGLESSLELGAPEILPKVDGQLLIDRFGYKLTLTNTNLNTLVNYLKEFEKMQFFAGLETLSVNSADAGGLNGEVTVNLSGNLYVKERD